MADTDITSGRRRWPRVLLLLAIYTAILVAGHLAGSWLNQHLLPDADGTLRAQLLVLLAVSLVAYAILLALPFVPGMEISLAIMAALGAKAALPIYIATVAGLLTAYLAGRLVPIASLSAVFRFLGLESATSLIARLEPTTRHQRLEALTLAAPSRIVPFLLRYRYIAVAAALNTPGNAVIGGGGGIAMLAGMSGLFSLPLFVLALCAAALPVPLMIFLAGRWL